jgi:glycosyltransferase involved in cell wall biosynthesis
MEEQENIEKCLLYKNSEERDLIKQFFTNPPSVDRSKKTIIFSTPSETGTSYFRLFEPMRVMWKHFRDEANFIYTENIQPNHLKLGDLIIMHRAGNLHSHFLSVAELWPKSETKPFIIHDVDDNEFNLPKTHPMRELWYASEKDKMSIQALKQSEFVCTTTEKLRKTFSNFNKDVYIHRNMFDWELPQWNHDQKEIRKEMLPKLSKATKSKEEPIIIGWAGLTSHFEDIKRMHTIFKAIHDKYPNTFFVLAGMALKDSAFEIEYDDNGKPKFKSKDIEDDNQKYRNRVINLYSDLDPERLEVFDALPLEEYGKFYSLFDISYAYIEMHNSFNSCKSEIKVVEALRYGCIPQFTNYGGYNDFWKSVPKDIKMENCAVNVSNSGKWVESASYWIDKIEENRKKNKLTPLESKMEFTKELKKWSDNTYNWNLNVEDRLAFYLEKTEEFQESEMNRLAASFENFDGIKM